MAENAGVMKSPLAIVVSDSPDVCLVPVGPNMVPTPFTIVQTFDQAQATTPTVLFKKLEAFVTSSLLRGVRGDEAGVGGGMKSGVFGPGGVCYVVPSSHTPVVYAEKKLVVFHTSQMWMNAPALGAPGNTQGRVMFVVVPPPVPVDEGGTPQGDTAPDASPETEQELKQEVGKPDEVKAGGSSGASPRDRADQRRWESDPDPTASDDPISTSTEVNATFENKLVDESLYQTPDGNLTLGHYTDTESFGAGFDPTTGGYKATAGRGFSFSTIEAKSDEAQFAGVGTASVDTEFLGARANAVAEATGGGTGEYGVRAEVGAEVIVAEAVGKAALRLTPKAFWDATFGAAIKSSPHGVYNPLYRYAEAPDSWDKGIEIGVSGTAGVGAAAQAGGEVGYNPHPKAGEKRLGAKASAKLGLGPKVGLKAFINVIWGGG